MQGIAGTIYAPSAQLAESGNAQVGSTTNPVSIIVDTLSISGNGIANALSLSSPAGIVAYTPAQIRAAYGMNNLTEDGTARPSRSSILMMILLYFFLSIRLTTSSG